MTVMKGTFKIINDSLETDLKNLFKRISTVPTDLKYQSKTSFRYF